MVVIHVIFLGLLRYPANLYMKVATKSQAVKVGNLGCFLPSNRIFDPINRISGPINRRNGQEKPVFKAQNPAFELLHNRVAKPSDHGRQIGISAGLQRVWRKTASSLFARFSFSSAPRKRAISRLLPCVRKNSAACSSSPRSNTTRSQ